MNNEEETNKLFWKHEDGLEWLYTGDLEYIDENQGLKVVIVLTESEKEGKQW